jgi:hypothetical protein
LFCGFGAGEGGGVGGEVGASGEAVGGGCGGGEVVVVGFAGADPVLGLFNWEIQERGRRREKGWEKEEEEKRMSSGNLRVHQRTSFDAGLVSRLQSCVDERENASPYVLFSSCGLPHQLGTGDHIGYRVRRDVRRALILDVAEVCKMLVIFEITLGFRDLHLQRRWLELNVIRDLIECRSCTAAGVRVVGKRQRRREPRRQCGIVC